MTARVGSKSIDGTPISEADMARIEAEDLLHANQQRSAVRVVAAGSIGAEDCRTLLAILGLDGDVALAARAELAAARQPARPKRARKTRAA